jgi:hypothetical protein
MTIYRNLISFFPDEYLCRIEKVAYETTFFLLFYYSIADKKVGSISSKLFLKMARFVSELYF